MPAVYEVRVAAPGFALKIETVDLRTAPNATLEIRLETGRITEQVIVTPARSEQRLGDVPASVTVMDSEEIRRSPAVVADDVLRQIPTFSLFRRTSSLSSHPTSQGVSLRGIGPSGTSRTLVLIDGVPFNDPFGGWVYWTRGAADERRPHRVVDGSTLEPVRQLRDGRRHQHRDQPPDAPNGGDQAAVRQPHQSEGRLLRQRPWDRLGVAVEGSLFNTDGFPIVAESERGPIDNNATSSYRNVTGKFDYNPTDRVTRSSAPAISPRTASTRRSVESQRYPWTTASGGVRILLPDQEQPPGARLFVDDRRSTATFWR